MSDLEVGRFDSGEYDVAQFVRHLAEQRDYGHSRRWPNLTKRYLENDLYLHACFSVGSRGPNYEAPRHYSAVFKLAFYPHSVGGKECPTERLGLDVGDSGSSCKQLPVFVWIVEFVEGVEKPR